ncbi:DNA polymerase Y family protein [Lentzea tibetensis]|uniref:DNA polymerase Y family protein n=1 Tax=Lentzea tibetensis TaxID=2591470 RepID=A0A563EFQ8_9PSEU|nr:DNA polymerase Y family protein [Lentzea tibetensis]TWP44898.1 DNA polymerase Y family protein [Lentzea tibetensis]
MRLLMVWCPDWPVIAAAATESLPPHVPAAVAKGNAIVACSAIARAEGVRRGMRKRQAQERCPELKVFEADPTRDARLFEPVAAAVEELAPGIEVVRPGLVAVAAKGPLGYFDGPERAAERVVDHVAHTAGVEAQVGIAEGLFAATLAAHRGVIVPEGGSAEFLAPLGIQELNDPDLVDLLRRLGLRTLGAFAALPERAVADRFGGPAVQAHRRARALEDRPVDKRTPPEDLEVVQQFDPPVERVDQAAFAAKALAERLHAELTAKGFACTRLGIHANTENDEELHRVWRCAEPLTPRGIADRVRWQLDGWLTREALTAGVTTLRLVPEELVDAAALQFGLWGHDQGAERAARALVHVQGLLGPEGVFTAVLGGGRGPEDQIKLVPWGDERTPRHDPAQPWPGRLNGPSPATVKSRSATVVDNAGQDIGVTGRNELTGAPMQFAVNGGPLQDVVAWSGPWPVDERWWEPDTARRAARLQLIAGGTAFLLVREDGEWTVEGMYD